MKIIKFHILKGRKFFEDDATFMYSIGYHVINSYAELQNLISFEDLIEFIGFLFVDDFEKYLLNNTELLFYGTR